MPVNSEATVELLCNLCSAPFWLIRNQPLSDLGAASKRAAEAGWIYDPADDSVHCPACAIRESKDLTIDPNRNGFELAVSFQGKDWSKSG